MFEDYCAASGAPCPPELICSQSHVEEDYLTLGESVQRCAPPCDPAASPDACAADGAECLVEGACHALAAGELCDAGAAPEHDGCVGGLACDAASGLCQ